MTQSLLTTGQAADRLGISKSTLRRYDRQGKLKATSRTPTGQRRYSSDALAKFQGKQDTKADPTQSVSRLVPGGSGGWLVSPSSVYSGSFKGGRDFYVPADRAIIESRENARRMWSNLVVRESLQSRLWASAEQAGHVEPEDKKDPRQLQIASDIQKVIEAIPDFLKLKYCLLKSRYFGTYGVQLQYRYVKGKISVQAWSPVHGDSLIFKQNSDDIGIYTSIASSGAKKVTTEAGYIGRAHVLDDGREVYFDDKGLPYQKVGFNERQAFLLMSYDPDPSDFLDPRGAGGIKGLGIRSTIYPTWYACQEIMGNLVEWIERFGTGITLYKFLRGDQASYNAAKELAESNSNQAAILVPVDPNMNGGRPVEGVERIEASAVGLENMVKVIEDIFNSQIRRFIVGQDSTSQPANMGLGSKIADLHASTFSRIIEFDTQDLSQTLTTQLVAVLQEWNHPDATDFACRYVVDHDEADLDKQMSAIKTAWEMDVSFDEDEVRSLTGMSKPDEESVLLKKSGAEAKPGEGHPDQAQAEDKPEQAEAAADGSLAQTVGGLQAIAALQSSFYKGEIPGPACVANVTLLFGFSEEEARSLFPQIPPKALTEDAQGGPGGPGPGGPGPGGAAPPEEQPQEEAPEQTPEQAEEEAALEEGPFGEDEEGEPDLYRFAGGEKGGTKWTSYTGPHGGKGWKSSTTGDVVYGDRPGGDGKDKTSTSDKDTKGSKDTKDERQAKASDQGNKDKGNEGVDKAKPILPKSGRAINASDLLSVAGKAGAEVGKAVQSTKADAGAVASRIGAREFNNLSPKWQTRLVKAGEIANKVEHKLEGNYTAGQNLAKAVAKERGMSEEHTERVGNILGRADAVARWTTNIPVVHEALELTGVGGVVGFLGAKIGYYVPVASLGYVGYAMVAEVWKGRNPFKMIMKARKAMKAKAEEKHGGH